MKFLIDMPLSPILAAWLRDLGHDAIHATAVGLHQASDTEILTRAATENRVVVTADLDFPRLLALARADGPGLILLRGGNLSDAESMEWLRRVLMAIPHHELPECITSVDRDHVRRRRLPI